MIIFLAAIWGIVKLVEGATSKFTQKKPQKSKGVTQPEVLVPIEKVSASTSGNYNDDDIVPEEKDNWERFDFYKANMVPAKGRYRITYTDQRGLTTERDIDIKRAHDDNGMLAVDAHCNLRGAHRSFIDDRIQSAVDLDTGEVVESVAQHAIGQYDNGEAGKVWKAIGREMMPVYLLVFVCRADGRMLKLRERLLQTTLNLGVMMLSLMAMNLTRQLKPLAHQIVKNLNGFLET